MLDDKIRRFYPQTKSANFCMTEDRCFLADFIDRLTSRLLSLLLHSDLQCKALVVFNESFLFLRHLCLVLPLSSTGPCQRTQWPHGQLCTRKPSVTCTPANTALLAVKLGDYKPKLLINCKTQLSCPWHQARIQKCGLGGFEC